jgi:hypothetical protein
VQIDSKIKNTIRIQDAFWTDANGNQIGKSVPLPGFEAARMSPIIEFTMFNDFSEPVIIHDLQFMLSDTLIPLELLIPFTLGGFGPSQPAFTLLPGAQLSFPVGSGQFLLAQFTSAPASDPTNEASIMYEHEDVPEPATLTLVILSLICLITFRLRYWGA